MSEIPSYEPPAARGAPAIPRWSPHVVRRLVRRPRFFWSAAVVLAVATALIVSAATAEARRLRDRYGDVTPVLVVTESVAAGTSLSGLTEPLLLPAAFVPERALIDLEAGTVAAAPLSAGSIITAVAVRPGGRLRDDRAALALPRTPTTPPAQVGQTVVLVVGSDPFAGIEPVLVDGLVIESSEDQIVLAIARDDLIVASAGLSAGTAVIALSGR